MPKELVFVILTCLTRRNFLEAAAAFAAFSNLPRAHAAWDEERAVEPPPIDEFFVVPLRVHILTSIDVEELNCTLSDEDVGRILKKANGVWRVAGVHWGLETIIREPAARQGRFKLAQNPDGSAPLPVYRIVLPEDTRAFEGVHVYFIHKFPVNGVHMGGDFVIVQDAARLKPVEGGIDEPIPRVVSHELGHFLGLPHRQDRTNLLASGTTGVLLNTKEIQTARANAEKAKGAIKAVDLEKAVAEAKAKDKPEIAQRCSRWKKDVYQSEPVKLESPPKKGEPDAEKKAAPQDDPAFV